MWPTARAPALGDDGVDDLVSLGDGVEGVEGRAIADEVLVAEIHFDSEHFDEVVVDLYARIRATTPFLGALRV
jgi:hypothetical protein